MAEVDVEGLQGKPPEQASTTEPQSNACAPPGLSLADAPGTPKNIFVCCDGTGNEFAAKDSLNSNSNVVKFYTALNLTRQQVAYYHPGVGTMGDPTKQGVARQWSVVKGLAFGLGFRENVLDAYRYLMQHYASGDRVFILGFSRGAYTARALAGLLHGYGLLCRGNEGHIPYAWRMYSQSTATQKELNAHTIKPDTTFRDTFSHKGFSIYFVGLWDTVSSIGWVRTPLRLLDLAQNSMIQRGRHAISIDERRCFYQDNLWGGPVTVDVPIVCTPAEAAEIPKTQDLRQVWFAGVHSDIGGGYPQLQSGLANTALRWMIDEVKSSCTRIDPATGKTVSVVDFDEARIRMVLGTPGPGEPTPFTAALAPLYEKPKSFKLHPSLNGLWWVLEVLPHRFYDKDDSSVRTRVPFGAYRKIPTLALVHSTVRDRFESHPCYRPHNLAPDELIPAPGVPGTHTYFRFEPKSCRDYALRQNWFFVFLVKVLEFSLLLYIPTRLSVALLRRIFSHHHLTRLGNLYTALDGFVLRHSPLAPRTSHIFLLLLIVAACTLTRELIVAARTR